LTNVALVTGASSGLGTGFARKLAAQKTNLLLVARRAERLELLAAELQEAHGVKVFVLAQDLAVPGAANKVYDHCRKNDLTVETLINNAGFGARGSFTDLDGKWQAEMIQLNCTALMELCHVFVPGMIQRTSGGVLNVASTAAFQPGPWMAVYYATKAFVLSFSEALHEEVKIHGVHVSALCPGPTQTEFADVADLGGTDLFKMFAGKPDAVERHGLAALKANKAVKISGLMNWVIAQSMRFTPRFLGRQIAGALQKGRQG
jgi:uncharacterized protein